MLCHLYSFLVQILEGRKTEGCPEFPTEPVLADMKAQRQIIQRKIFLKMMFEQHSGFCEVGGEQGKGFLLRLSDDRGNQDVCQKCMGQEGVLTGGKGEKELLQTESHI